jgi:hypothetical protein
MTKRMCAWIGLSAVLAFMAIPVAAQTPAKKAGGPKSGAAMKTADGQPDIQGVWDFRTVTPLERPDDLAGKEFLTPKEADEYATKIVASRDADANRAKEALRVVNGTNETQDVQLAYNNFWWDRGTKVVGNLRTSLITSPADGKIPALTEEGKKRQAERAEIQSRPAWGPEDRSVGERCIMGFNAGPPMNPGGYNMNVHIVQNKDYVLLLNEMVHNARIVPIDNRPFTGLRQWSGESRGHWEGNTLVVETKNFYQTTSLQNSTPNYGLVERFTRLENGVLQYEYTVTDPTTWTKPWSAQIQMTLGDQPIYEYACHEGNYGMYGLLAGARAVEKGPAAKKGSN